MTKTITTALPKYKPSTHAIERFSEYYGVKEIYAVEFANELMGDAHFIMKQPDGRRIYQNDEHDTLIILAPETDIVITINPSPVKRKVLEARTKGVSLTAFNNPILSAAHATIKRELAKARRSFTTELRKLKIEQAELGVEIAQATVNKVRCLAPHTQELIQQRIDASQAYYDVVGTKIERVQAEYKRTKTEAQAFLGDTETT